MVTTWITHPNRDGLLITGLDVTQATCDHVHRYSQVYYEQNNKITGKRTVVHGTTIRIRNKTKVTSTHKYTKDDMIIKKHYIYFFTHTFSSFNDVANLFTVLMAISLLHC